MPFNSQVDDNVLYDEAAGDAQFRAFANTWIWDHSAAEHCAVLGADVGYPALLHLYSAGVAAVASGHCQLLASLLTSPVQSTASGD